MTNPITQQIREARHRLASKFGNDLDRIVDDLQRQQRESGRHVVDRSKDTTNHAIQRSDGGNVSSNGDSSPAARWSPPLSDGGNVQPFSNKQQSQEYHLLAMLQWRDREPIITVEQAIKDISALPPHEQLRVVQAIWDRLSEGVGTELTESQRAELDRRWAKYKADASTAFSEEEFRERIRVARGLWRHG
jgi:putative addiction module component (TIGR02574 family)